MYPDTPNFEPSRLVCPSCGATNSNRSDDRIVQGNTRFVLDDDGLRVIFEVACPCGFRDEVTIGAAGIPADADDLASELAPEDGYEDVEEAIEDAGSIVDDAVDAGSE